MPNRVIREGIITSESVNALTWPAEVFYRRLLSIVDDFGRYHAHASLLRAACYPLQLDKVGNADIAKWLGETRKAGLVSVYTDGQKQYLRVLKFDQRVRAEKSKFPDPPSDDGQLTVICQTSAPEVEDGDGVVDDKPTAMSGKPDHPPINGVRKQAIEVLDFLNAKAGRNFQPVDANLKLIAARLKEGATVDDCRAVVAMKVREWKSSEWAEYLRPATLFNAEKFAQYRGKLIDASDPK